MKNVRIHSTQSPALPGQVKSALRELQAALRQLYGVQAPQVLIYGSYARGEANEASDVDVLLLYPEKVSAGSEIQRLGSILADLNIRYQVLISVLPASQNELQNSHDSFWNNIRREEVTLV